MRFDVRSIVRAAGIAVPIVLGLLLGRFIAPWLPEFSAWVHTLGVWAPVAFVAAYIVVVVLMLPAFLLIMAGGAVFGVVKGSLLVMCGAMAGGTVAFLIARYLARTLVERRVAANPTLAAIDRVIGEDGLRLVFLLRLSPAIPFVLSNYALGVTRVRLRDFVLGTLGLAPIVVTYAAYGSASGAGPRADGSAAVSPLMLGLGIAITVLLGVVLARLVQRALREAELTRLKQVAAAAQRR
ncbi:MAG: TVP38/TMEM64 family protein [Gemmatimonadaceae bacterium]|nr:TVP38/TMEM64 family protein [Gemmatimonadaceae bacterium]